MLPLPGVLRKLNFAAQQIGQFAADGQTEPGAAVLAAGACVGLLERLEDDALFLGRNTDAGISHLEGDDGCRRRSKSGDRRSSRRIGKRHRKANAALLGKLERVGEQVLEHLLQALGVCDQAATPGSDRLKRRTTSRRFSASWRNGRATVSSRLAEEHFFRLDGNGSRFDLRKIENVADQVQQVGAGAVNGAGEFDLLWRSGCRRDYRSAAGPGRECC